jgi:hypothetical protein
MDFDRPLHLRHTKHYAVFHDQEDPDFARTDLHGVYQTARQAFIALKRLRLDAFNGFIYAIDGNAGLIHDNGIGLLRVLDGSYVGWGHQFCVPGEHVLINLRVKATFVYYEDLHLECEDEGVGSSSSSSSSSSSPALPDDFTEWMLHCEIPFEEAEDGLVEQAEFRNVNGAHAEENGGDGSRFEDP